MYEPVAINVKDKMVLDTLRKNAVINIKRLEDDLTTMTLALKTYRESFDDSLDLSIEEADIVAKYATKPTMGSYTLPAILVGTRADYDINRIKDDNERLESLKDLAKSSRIQTSQYLKILTQAYHDLSNEMKKAAMFAANMEQAIAMLRGD
jgi:hypothetical protein